MPASPRAHVLRAAAGDIAWEVAARPLPERLRPYVRSCVGYTERTPGPSGRREYPGPRVVVILETGPPIRVYESGSERRSERFAGGFAAGLDETWTLCEHDGFQAGVQLDLTPLGARAFFGLPMSELAGRALPLADLLTGDARDFCARLAELPTWDAKLDAVEALVEKRLAAARLDARPVAWALRQIEARGGAVDVGALARELGWSHKHLIARFRDQVGLPPKRVARVVRFDRLLQRLRRGTDTPWADLALELGFSDQAHLAREVRAFTGRTPTGTRAALAAELFPSPG
jgi:AraC-like DNA-binding protein